MSPRLLTAEYNVVTCDCRDDVSDSTAFSLVSRASIAVLRSCRVTAAASTVKLVLRVTVGPSLAGVALSSTMLAVKVTFQLPVCWDSESHQVTCHLPPVVGTGAAVVEVKPSGAVSVTEESPAITGLPSA